MTRLLVVGASGLVGSELCRRGGFEGGGAARKVEGAATVVLALLDRGSIDAALSRSAPQTVAVCSAWPYVDGCEKEPERSHRENVETVANLVAATAGSKTGILFFSTDH